VRVPPLLLLLAFALALVPSAQAAGVPPAKALYHDGPTGRYLLNGSDWLVRRDPKNVGRRRHYFGERGTRGWDKVSVPNAWNAKDVSNASMAGSITWYRKDFRAPSASASTAWLLHFDNVRYRATVWLNGRQLGSHAGAYLPWELRARGLARSGVNRLVVRVDNITRKDDLPPARLTVTGAPNGGWWNYGGILGDVYLRSVHGIDLEAVQVRPAVSCSTCAARVSVSATVRNYTRKRARVSVSGKFGSSALRFGKIAIGPGKVGSVAASLRIAKPHLWSPDDPFLYDVALSARGSGGSAAGYRVYSGLRSIAVRGGRLRLNGFPTNFRGMFFHEDDPVAGGAVPHAREELFVKLMKDVGGTVLRTHYPVSPYLHELADRRGLMIWSEIPVYQVPHDVLEEPRVQALAARMLSDDIAANGNHPSVMAWSIGNELRSKPGEIETRYFRSQAALAHRLDPTRPVALAIAGYASIGCQAAYAPIQLIGINMYFGWYQGPDGELADRDRLSGAMDAMRSCYPRQALAVTELGAEGNRDGPVEERGTYGYQAELYDYHLNVYATKPWLSGATGTLMTFKARPEWDGGNPLPNPPFHDKGVFDYFGKPKPAAAVVSSWYHRTKQYGP
jgi:beta-glucuronidase